MGLRMGGFPAETTMRTRGGPSRWNVDVDDGRRCPRPFLFFLFGRWGLSGYRAATPRKEPKGMAFFVPSDWSPHRTCIRFVFDAHGSCPSLSIPHLRPDPCLLFWLAHGWISHLPFPCTRTLCAVLPLLSRTLCGSFLGLDIPTVAPVSFVPPFFYQPGFVRTRREGSFG